MLFRKYFVNNHLNVVFHYIGCVQISNDRDVQIAHVGGNATLNWRITGVPDGSIFVLDVFYYNSHRVEIFTGSYRKNNLWERLSYSYDSPIDRNRINGYLNLNAGNGTLSVNLYNVRFNDSRVFSFEFFSSSSEEVVNNITVDAQSKSLCITFSDL